jgi:hypothetical protein
MSKSAFLSNPDTEPPTVAFLSRVIAANPDKIAEWMTTLADLPASDRETLFRAIWLSDAKEGKRYLEEKGVTKYLKKPTPDILKIEIDSPDVLDMLWGYFFATGDDAPIRRIVSAFNYGEYAGALKRYSTPGATEEDKKHAEYEAIFRVTTWSLRSNCRKHPRVKECCDHLLHGNELNPIESRCLEFSLAQLDSRNIER